MRREGHEINHKRVYRLYSKAILAVKGRLDVERVPLLVPDRVNQFFSMDVVMDALACGRRLKLLTTMDDVSKEAIDLHADHSITGEDVVETLDQISHFPCYPAGIRNDQGPEFTGRALDQWAYRHGISLKLIRAGKRTQNAFIESFNGRLRDECLNEHRFQSLREAKEIISE